MTHVRSGDEETAHRLTASQLLGGVLAGFLAFALVDLVIGAVRSQVQVESAAEQGVLTLTILAYCGVAALATGVAAIVWLALGRLLTPLLGGRDGLFLLAFVGLAVWFHHINAETLNGPKIRAHPRYDVIVAVFRFGSPIGILFGLWFARRVFLRARKSAALRFALGTVLFGAGVAAAWMNATWLVGLYPMIHSQLVVAAALAFVVGAIQLRRFGGRAVALMLVLAAAIAAGGLAVHGTQAFRRVAAATWSRGPATAEFGRTVDGWFERIVPRQRLDGVIADHTLPADTAEAIAAAQSWLDEKLPGRTRMNVLFFAMDTVRADHTSFTSYGRPTTPRLDALAETAFVFEHAYAPFPTSNYSYSATYTSMAPRSSPMYDLQFGDSKIAFRDEATIAGLLRARGWSTLAVSGFNKRSSFDDSLFGLLTRGFVSYNPEPTIDNNVAPGINDVALRMLDRETARPFFLLMHYLEPHDPYVVWDGFDFGADRIDAYDSEIAYTDHHIGLVLDDLKRRGELDQTVVVVFSDHGEEFDEHGQSFHNSSLYEQQIHVPLMIWVPGLKGRRVATTVSLLDLVPTLTGLLGVKDPVKRQGRNLLPLMLDPADRGEGQAYAEHWTIRSGKRTREKRALVVGRKKIIRHTLENAVEIYDVEKDPLEQRNLVGRDDALETSLLGQLLAWEQRVAAWHAADPDQVRDPATEFRDAVADAFRIVQSTDHEAAGEAIRAIRQSLMDYVGDPSAESIHHLGDELYDRHVQELIEGLPAQKDSRTRVRVINLLAGLERPASIPFFRLLAESAKEPNYLGVLAATTLAAMGDDSARDLLQRAVDMYGPPDKRTVVIALARLGEVVPDDWLMTTLTVPKWRYVAEMFEALVGNATFAKRTPSLGWTLRDYVTERFYTAKLVEYKIARSIGELARDDTDLRRLVLRFAREADPTTRDAAAESMTAAGIGEDELEARREAIDLELAGEQAIRNYLFDVGFENWQRSLELDEGHDFNPGLRLRFARYLHLQGERDRARALLEGIRTAAPRELDRQLAERRLAALAGPARIGDAAAFSPRVSGAVLPPRAFPLDPILVRVRLKNAGSVPWQGGYWACALAFRIAWLDDQGQLVPEQATSPAYLPPTGVLPGEECELVLLATPPRAADEEFRPVLIAEQIGQVGLTLPDSGIIYRHPQTLLVSRKSD